MIRLISVWFLLTAVFLSACSSLTGGKTDKTAEGLVLRYVNLQAVYEALLAKSDRAQSLTAQKTEVYERIESVQQALILENGDKQALVAEMSSLRKKYDSILEEEKNLKEEIYKQINRALSSLAKESGTDFIFNMGEGLVYGAAKYDMTEDLLREVVKIDRRSDSVLR